MMTDREKVIRDLQYLKSFGRVSNNPQITEIAENAIDMLKEQEKLRLLIDENGHITPLTNREQATVKAEIEGGGSSWWYVCSECHGKIDKNDQYCRHCGGRITE